MSDEEYRNLFMPTVASEILSQGKFDLSAYNNIKKYCSEVDNRSKSDNIFVSIFKNVILPIYHEL